MISQERNIKEQTTDVAIMLMFASDCGKLLENTKIFDSPKQSKKATILKH